MIEKEQIQKILNAKDILDKNLAMNCCSRYDLKDEEYLNIIYLLSNNIDKISEIMNENENLKEE